MEHHYWQQLLWATMVPALGASVYSRTTVAVNTQLHEQLLIIHEATFLSATVASNKVASCMTQLTDNSL